MNFASPIWLLGLLPWAAVVAYLLWNRRKRVDVPFLDLWPSQAEGVRVRRRATPPPIAIALAILATLLAIVAGGRPVVRIPWAGPLITVVDDRGYTMSARAGERTRASSVLSEVSGPVRHISADHEKFARMLVPDAPGLGFSRADDTPTALDARELLIETVREHRREYPDRPVVVVTDQMLPLQDDLLIIASPETSVRNARIVALAARETPVPQVMIRLRGGPGFGAAKLRVTSAGQAIERDVQIPASGERDEFIDLPKLGDSVRADLLVDDDQPADDSAWLVREASWPRLEARTPLAAHVQRMVDVYAKQRPPTDASKRLVIVSAIAELPSGEAGVVVARRSGDSTDAKLSSPPEVASHPVTKEVSWSDVGTPAAASEELPAGWTPIVRSGGKVWVAVREQPIRAVWVGFDTSLWSRSSDFVVFWANVFNWAGSGAERFAAYPVGSLEEGQWTPVELAKSVAEPQQGLWPGLYRRGDGVLRAINAPDVPIPPARDSGWRDRLAKLAAERGQSGGGRFELAPVALLAALACLGLAAMLWKRRREVGIELGGSHVAQTLSA